MRKCGFKHKDFRDIALDILAIAFWFGISAIGSIAVFFVIGLLKFIILTLSNF